MIEDIIAEIVRLMGNRFTGTCEITMKNGTLGSQLKITRFSSIRGASMRGCRACGTSDCICRDDAASG